MESSPSERHNEDGDDLLEVSVYSFSPRSGFSRWHRPTCRRARPSMNSTMTRLVTVHSSLISILTLLQSPSSNPHEDEAPLPGQLHVISRSGVLPVPSTSVTRSESHLDAVDSPQGRSTFKKWRQRVGMKDLGLHKPGRLSRKLREPADPPPRVDDRQEGPSTMAVSAFL